MSLASLFQLSFPKLKELHIRTTMIRYSEQDSLAVFLSNHPLLERLTLEHEFDFDWSIFPTSTTVDLPNLTSFEGPRVMETFLAPTVEKVKELCLPRGYYMGSLMSLFHDQVWLGTMSNVQRFRMLLWWPSPNLYQQLPVLIDALPNLVDLEICMPKSAFRDAVVSLRFISSVLLG